MPAVTENYILNEIGGGGNMVHLCLYDTVSGLKDYDRIRPLNYPGTDVFILCFSIISPISLSSIKCKWLPEVLHYCPSAKLLLVGTKADLRHDPKVLEGLKRDGLQPISCSDGEKVAREIAAVAYVECSALMQQNLNQVFEEAIKAIVVFNPYTKR